MMPVMCQLGTQNLNELESTFQLSVGGLLHCRLDILIRSRLLKTAGQIND